MTRKSGLGRGLDALLPASPAETDGAGLVQAPVGAIRPNPDQPRRTFDEEELEQLARSISELGMLQPVLVRRMGPDDYELVAGERRWRAAQRAGLERVPALVVETDDRGALERALVENVQRADLNPIEEAAAYKQLLDDGGLTHEQLGSRIGRNRVTVTNSLRLLDLPPQVQRLLIEGRLTAGHARPLLAVPNPAMQERIARRIADEGLSVRDAESLVRRFQAFLPQAPSTAGSAEPPAAAAEAQRRLSDALHARVKVEMGMRKGRITIQLSSLEELQRITEAIAVAAESGDPAKDQVTPGRENR